LHRSSRAQVGCGAPRAGEEQWLVAATKTVPLAILNQHALKAMEPRPQWQ
jgi:hypothetical protein